LKRRTYIAFLMMFFLQCTEEKCIEESIPPTECSSLEIYPGLDLKFCDTMYLWQGIVSKFGKPEYVEELVPTTSLRIVEDGVAVELNDAHGKIDYLEGVHYNKDRRTEFETISIGIRSETPNFFGDLVVLIYERGKGSRNWYKRLEWNSAMAGMEVPGRTYYDTSEFKWMNTSAFQVVFKDRHHRKKDTSYYAVIGTDVVEISKKQSRYLRNSGRQLYRVRGNTE